MLAILDLVPRWLWMALVVALSATSCKLKWDNGQLSIEIEKGKTYVAQLERSISQANEASAATALADNQRVRAAEEAANSRVRALAADRASANTELARLRDALAVYTAPSGLTGKAGSLAPTLDTADPLPDLLVQCSSRYSELAGKADGHASDVQTLMAAWPK